MKILVINGPNINMLGIREPGIYGSETFADVIEKIKRHAESRGIEVGFFQSNHEGALVDEIQAAWGKYDGIVINPGAYTHTSIAIADALAAVRIPTVEIHISDVDKREAFRHISYIRPLCVGCIKGHGTDGYLEAVDLLVSREAAQS